jgi:hypothetical protein
MHGPYNINFVPTCINELKANGHRSYWEEKGLNFFIHLGPPCCLWWEGWH